MSAISTGPIVLTAKEYLQLLKLRRARKQK